MYRSERDCIKHSGSRLFMFRTWIIRQYNTVWVHKLTDIVTSLDSKLVRWTMSYSKWYMYVETFWQYHIWSKWGYESVNKWLTFIKHSWDRREERRIHRWINRAKYFTIYQSYIVMTLWPHSDCVKAEAKKIKEQAKEINGKTKNIEGNYRLRLVWMGLFDT